MGSFFVKSEREIFKTISERCDLARKEKPNEIEMIERHFGNLDDLIRYYIVPYAQNVNPADFEEDDTGLVARGKIFDLFSKFLMTSRRFRHAFVLSDAGMGKTSLLVMLKFFEVVKVLKVSNAIHLFKLDDNVECNLENIQNISESIILLDSLDEDKQAWSDFHSRLTSLLNLTENSFKTIITCRTQFFPREYEEDGIVPGQIIYSGHHCSKLFLSLFSDGQATKYINRRFTSTKQRKKARQMVAKMHHLKCRPMLLAYTDYLLEYEHEFSDTYSVYEALVDEWLNRELRKKNISSRFDKEEMFETCCTIAGWLYVRKERSLNREDLHKVASRDQQVFLDQMEVEGRSLLHRDSRGYFKFSHFSIQEFFIAYSLARKPNSVPNTDMVINFLRDLIVRGRLLRCHSLDLKKIKISNAALKEVDFGHSVLEDAEFVNCYMETCSFEIAKCHGIVFKDCQFKRCKLSSANLEKMQLRSSCFIDSDFSDAVMNGARLYDSKIEGSNFSDFALDDVHIERCDISSSDIRRFKIRSGRIELLKICNTHIGDISIDNLVNSQIIFDSCNLNSLRITKVGEVKLEISQSNPLDFEVDESKAVHIEMISATVRKFRINHDSEGKLEFSDTEINELDLRKFQGLPCRFDRCIFNVCSFSDAELAGSSFINCDLGEAYDFSGANVSGVLFEGTDVGEGAFEKAIFDSATRWPSQFDMDRTGAIGPGISIQGVELAEARLTGVELCGSQLKDVKFSKAKLDRAKFGSATVQACNFDDADLHGADFKSSKLGCSSFRHARLAGTDFGGASFHEVDFSYAIFDKKTNLPSRFDPGKLRMFGPEINVTDEEFTSLTIQDVDFSLSVISRCKFTSVIFKGCSFSSARLVECEFQGCQFLDVNMVKSSMISPEFSGCFYDQKTNFPSTLSRETPGLDPFN